MHPWNEGRLMEVKPGSNIGQIFDKYFRAELGEHAEAASAICQKFCDKGMIDQFELLGSSIESGKVSECIKELTDIYEDQIVAEQIPHVSKMTEDEILLLARSFLIADLSVR